MASPDHPIANGVAWVAPARPEPALPTLLRYDTGDFFNGHGYEGPLDAEHRVEHA